MDYLYFPDNRLEYIPGAISVVLVIIIAFFVIKLLKRHSEKELLKAKELESKILENEKRNTQQFAEQTTEQNKQKTKHTPDNP